MNRLKTTFISCLLAPLIGCNSATTIEDDPTANLVDTDTVPNGELTEDTDSLTGEDTTSNADADPPPTGNGSPAVVLIVAESGGCVRIGPNCAVYRLFSDANFEVARTGTFGTSGVEELLALQAEARGDIELSLTTGWIEQAGDEDFSALRERLLPGRCMGCVDGVDIQYVMIVNEQQHTFSSIEYALNPSEPLFALTEGILQQMRALATLDVQSRF